MKALSLKLKEDVFNEVENVIKKNHISRNTYINEALSFYNKLNRRRLLKKQLRKESQVVRDTSLEVLGEFEKFEESYH